MGGFLILFSIKKKTRSPTNNKRRILQFIQSAVVTHAHAQSTTSPPTPTNPAWPSTVWLHLRPAPHSIPPTRLDPAWRRPVETARLLGLTNGEHRKVWLVTLWRSPTAHLASFSIFTPLPSVAVGSDAETNRRRDQPHTHTHTHTIRPC